MTKTFDPATYMLGQYSKYDGTIEFYGRIRSILSKEFVVLDFGAGRGAWYSDGVSSFAKSVRTLKPDVQMIIGCDVDAAIFENQSTHENLLTPDGTIPLDDDSIDVIIADYVLEHITNTTIFYSEVYRVLKRGGFFCARTPTAFNYVSIGARLVKNTKHSTFIKHLQPGRKEIDVFPTAYKLNTKREVRKLWSAKEWNDYSYVYTSEPQYFFGSRIVYFAMTFIHKILPEVITGNHFLFLQKK